MKQVKILTYIAFTFILLISFNTVYGTNALESTSIEFARYVESDGGSGGGGTPYSTSLLDKIFGQAKNWWDNANNITNDPNDTRNIANVGDTIANFFLKDVMGVLAVIGNFVFFVVAAFLGVKYIWSGVGGKTEVKETLPAFIVGATFFYSAKLIFDLVSGEFTALLSYDSFKGVTGTLWNTITYIVQILAISGIIAVGLKYMLSPADKKADLKQDLTKLLIGLIMVFSLSSVMNFIANVGYEIFR